MNRGMWSQEHSVMNKVWRIVAAGNLPLIGKTMRDWWRRRQFKIPAEKGEKEKVKAYLLEAFNWIRRAQVSKTCGGIPCRYDLVKQEYAFPYPETTGYSIPTLLHFSAVSGISEAEKAAADAVEWLLQRQSEEGWIRSNIEDPQALHMEPPKMVNFDNGAMLQGLCAAHVRCRDPRTGEAARRLAHFLIRTQEEDGTWKKNCLLSHFGSWNSLVGYSLILAGTVLKYEEAESAGHRCLDAISRRIHRNGFIANTDLSESGDQNRAFLHTFAYAIEGYVKAHMLLPERGYLARVSSSINALLRISISNGGLLVSHFDKEFRPLTGFSALTALCQLADIWFKVANMTREMEYVEAASRLMAMVRSCISLRASDTGWRGGVPGSFPIWGSYDPYCCNNWGAKYFIDASLEELKTLAGSSN